MDRLEPFYVNDFRQPNQRLGVGHRLKVDPHQIAVDQTRTHLALGLIETPTLDALEH
jgi:hypothetical protein